MSNPAVLAAGVARRFGRRWVLRGIDLAIQPGQVVALTGRNGSGKTTLLRLIASILRPTRGEIQVFGFHTIREGASVRPLVGMLAHNAGIYDDLTAAENLVFALRMAGHSARRAPISEVLDRVGLTSFEFERVRGFSAGMRRRLGLARLLLRPPRLLLLDEPYASFDQDGIELVNEFAARIRDEGGAVILSTHDIGRAAVVADRRAHIADGLLGEQAIPGVPAAGGQP
ncbi:MAG: heme ABC exporter ATP-binding protein CcmA [Gemmatimonadetes bacterium]|nr:heme ABC exporter ATP-binding protein CcmA [Gemmatimonadota bacterium]